MSSYKYTKSGRLIYFRVHESRRDSPPTLPEPNRYLFILLFIHLFIYLFIILLLVREDRLGRACSSRTSKSRNTSTIKGARWYEMNVKREKG